MTPRMKLCCCCCGVKVATTFCAWFIVTLHGPAPLQAPLQLVKVNPAAGVAVSVTGVPAAKLSTQVPGQLMLPGLLTTVPLPLTPTVSGKVCCCCWVKVATTFCAWFIVTLHGPAPLQAPPQLVKVNPAAGVAVSVTRVPAAKLFTQVPGQLMVPGLLTTVPLPLTPTVSGKVCCCCWVKVATTLRAW